MRRILYAMQFLGRISADARQPRVVRTTAFAPSCTVTTRIDPEGVFGSVEPAPGERATFEAEVWTDEVNRPRGMATITFGTAGHRLYLTLHGSFDLDGGPPTTARSALVWKVERGEGQFAGASGLITSNRLVRDLEEVTDSQLGVLLLAPGGRGDWRIGCLS